MFKSLTTIKKREEGQGLVEYALILVLVAVVVIVVLSLVGPGVGNIFSQVVTALNDGASGNITETVNGNCLAHNSGGNDILIDGTSTGNATVRSTTDGTCTGTINETLTFVNAGSQGAGDSACQAFGFTAGDHYDDNGYTPGWYRCY